MKIHVGPNGTLPAYQTTGSAGFDLCAAEDVVIEPGTVVLVSTDLIVAVPPGYYLDIRARSSLALKKGLMLANGAGVLDSDYCGPTDILKVILINVGRAPVSIQKGERIAQAILVPYVRATFEPYDPQAVESRGGFGSTGGYTS